MTTRLTLPFAALFLLSARVAADEIEVIFSEVAGHPTAVVPGAVDLGGNPIAVEFRAMEAFSFNTDGTQWILKANNDGGSDIESMLLLGAGSSGAVFAQEGQPVHDGVAGELYDSFNDVAGFNTVNDYAYGASARGGDVLADAKVIRFDGAYTMVAQEGDPALGLTDRPPAPSGDELQGASLNSIHLLDDGSVGYFASGLRNLSFSHQPALFYDDTAFAQSGVTPVAGDIWDSFTNRSFFTTPDGSRWIAIGDDRNPDFSTDGILAVDGTVVIREGSTLPGSSRVVDQIFYARLLANGDWFARGDDPSDEDWAVVNGTVVAETGHPITPGAPENWRAAFVALAANQMGDWVLVGLTDSPDIGADMVIVLNGRDVVVREGDPVDLDGNGIADDDAFIGRSFEGTIAFGPDDVFLTDDRTLYFIAPLRNAAGEDLGDPVLGGDAFLRLRLPASCASGNVDLASGSPQEALQISGSGGGPSRSVEIQPGETFSLSLDAANAGPAQGRFVVWAWIGEGRAPRDINSSGQFVGCTVNPTPLNLGLSPQPRFCLPGQGIPSFACTGTIVKNVGNFAPFSLNRNSGLANPITLTLQGLLEDSSTPHPQGYSVTNAVTLVVTP